MYLWLNIENWTSKNVHDFINKVVKSSYIFELKEQLPIAYPNYILDFLGQIKLHFEEHEESL